jgi:hypothetical protein
MYHSGYDPDPIAWQAIMQPLTPMIRTYQSR